MKDYINFDRQPSPKLSQNKRALHWAKMDGFQLSRQSYVPDQTPWMKHIIWNILSSQRRKDGFQLTRQSYQTRHSGWIESIATECNGLWNIPQRFWHKILKILSCQLHLIFWHIRDEIKAKIPCFLRNKRWQESDEEPIMVLTAYLGHQIWIIQTGFPPLNRQKVKSCSKNQSWWKSNSFPMH